MMRLLSELNHFSEATTVHGFAYLYKGQKLSTRIIWTLVVLGAAVVAGYFLYSTIKGFDKHYTSTTIETRSIQEYPFPAVTFHPGDFNSENAFTRMFFNQFEFTRYYDYDTMRDNDLFMRKFGWVVSNMNNEIFRGVKNYLLEEKRFIKAKGRIFEKEVCTLVALNVSKIDVEPIVMNKFAKNMYKIRGFSSLMRFIKVNVSKEINSVQGQQSNISKDEVSRICKEPEVGIIFGCEDTALQVLMSVCLCVPHVEILPSYSIQCNSVLFQNVPECMHNV